LVGAVVDVGRDGEHGFMTGHVQGGGQGDERLYVPRVPWLRISTFNWSAAPSGSRPRFVACARQWS